jgi:plastocyanin
MAAVRRLVQGETLVGACVLALTFAAPAGAAKEEILGTASYPDMSTFRCHTDAIPIHPGQNLNLFGLTKTCPNAEKVSGPGDPSTFAPGSTAQGYVTRFKPSMVEILENGRLTTPSVWDLHLHHVVWLAPNGGPTFASGEEKTEAKLPQGYGYKVGADASWGLNYMIHSLNSSEGRQVYITWEIDWVPESNPSIQEARVRWLDVAGAPQIYPVFDAERGFDTNGDGRYTFPDEVPTDPAAPGYEERDKISNARHWIVPPSGATLVFGAGHLHPGGKRVDLQVARDGPDAGEVDGDDPSEVRQLFRSNAKYYEPAGAVSWDVSMTATRPDWRVKLKGGDTVSISVTYDVRKASWYESMGIMPLAFSPGDTGADPFTTKVDVPGQLTHGRLAENSNHGGAFSGLPDPRGILSIAPPDGGRITISNFLTARGDINVTGRRGRIPTVRRGRSLTFVNRDANRNIFHTITSCKAPCNRTTGVAYPIANGREVFDSGELGRGLVGFTPAANRVTWKTPSDLAPGTYTYFCRVHPFMRGAFRVARD